MNTNIFTLDLSKKCVSFNDRHQCGARRPFDSVQGTSPLSSSKKARLGIRTIGRGFGWRRSYKVSGRLVSSQGAAVGPVFILRTRIVVVKNKDATLLPNQFGVKFKRSY